MNVYVHKESFEIVLVKASKFYTLSIWPPWTCVDLMGKDFEKEFYYIGKL